MQRIFLLCPVLSQLSTVNISKPRRTSNVIGTGCDSVLTDHLPSQPLVIFKKASCIKNHIAPSKLLIPAKGTQTSGNTFLSIFGCYCCNKSLCKTYSHMMTKKQSFEIMDCITCSTLYVWYHLICPCNKIYVGRTIRPLRERFREHRLSLEKGVPQFNVSEHFLKHNKDARQQCFWHTSYF